MMTQASIDIKKRPHVVFVESNTGYGTVRACALDMAKELDPREFTYLSYRGETTQWALDHGLPVERMLMTPGANNSKVWDMLLHSAVSVHESHDWWRGREALMKRALLAGSHKIQLWHGSTGPIGKEIGLGRLTAQPTFWHFAALAATSVSWDAMVHEPNADEARRRQRVQSTSVIHDIEYRLVPVLEDGGWRKPMSPMIIVAPTFPESVEGESTLVNWISRLGLAAATHGWTVNVHLHPSTKSSVTKKLQKVAGLNLMRNGVESFLLKSASIVVTDYSSIAHDALVAGTPVAMAVEGLDSYKQNREILIDQEQWDAVYIAKRPEELIPAILDALERDTLASARQAYRSSLLNSLGAKPGANTKSAILAALDAAR